MDQQTSLPRNWEEGGQTIYVRETEDGLVVSLGGGIERKLTPCDYVELQEGTIKCEMYTIEGEIEGHMAAIDLADIRSVGEGTPIQVFTSNRKFMDIPLSGVAAYIAQSPDGTIYHGLYDSEVDKNVFLIYGKDWTVTWIKKPGTEFRFLEPAMPRYIDEVGNIPIGDNGNFTIDPTTQRDRLSSQFWTVYDYYKAMFAKQ